MFAEEPIKAGQFIIEYVGEVLEEEEYLRRKEYYIEIGQRHFYFMNVGNGELIDACRKVSCAAAAAPGFLARRQQGPQQMQRDESPL